MRIVLIGFGVVAQAFVELLEQRREALYASCGLAPRIVGVVDRGGAAVSERGLGSAELLEAKRAHGTVAALSGCGDSQVTAGELIANSDADLVIEATPSRIDEPQAAIGHLQAAFRHGMHVITVNKSPLAVAMPAMLELARYNRAEFRYSGTVGAGTPVLAVARQCALGDEILHVRAILNGTTNYIAWRMHEHDDDFDAALAEAVRLGYAETDPSADIDGIDTATKVVIFANVILGRPATLRDVALEGMRGLSTERVRQARENGKVIKLIGDIDGELAVRPVEIDAGDPLNVPQNLNAIGLTLRYGGDVTLVGRGAGGVETATAILRDLVDVWHVIGSRS